MGRFCRSPSLSPTSPGTGDIQSSHCGFSYWFIHLTIKWSSTIWWMSTMWKALHSANWELGTAKAVWKRRLMHVEDKPKCKGSVWNARFRARQPISGTQRMIQMSREWITAARKINAWWEINIHYEQTCKQTKTVNKRSVKGEFHEITLVCYTSMWHQCLEMSCIQWMFNKYWQTEWFSCRMSPSRT